MSNRLETVLVESKSLGRKQPVNLFLPHSSIDNSSWRTLFLLHGMGGDHTRWAQNCDLEKLVGDASVLLVMPSCENGFYLDSPLGNFESFICKDLIEYVQSRFPVDNNPSSRGITGYSMGGYGAMILALRNPDLFGSAASHSGAVLTARATQEVGVKWELADTLYGTGSDGNIKRSEHDVLSLAQKFIYTDSQTGSVTYSGPRLYFDCGQQDFLYYASREVTQAMRMLHIPYEYYETPGDHDWQYWSMAAFRSFEFHVNRI
jgi:S-formylglutathione hydrolase FrmB